MPEKQAVGELNSYQIFDTAYGALARYFDFLVPIKTLQFTYGTATFETCGIELPIEHVDLKQVRRCIHREFVEQHGINLEIQIPGRAKVSNYRLGDFVGDVYDACMRAAKTSHTTPRPTQLAYRRLTLVGGQSTNIARKEAAARL